MTPFGRSPMTRLLRLAAFAFLSLAALSQAVYAQSLSKTAIQVDPGNTKQTGATFGYRLTYNCSSTSGPCLGAEVVDLLPPEVQYVSTVPASATGDVQAINVTPNFMGTGRTRVQFSFINPLPAGNSGDLLINVRFPNGSTPDGMVATNTADGINLETTAGTFTTPPVDVTAVATVQANVQKTLQTSPANLDLPETYRLRIGVPNNDGALNLTGIGPVVDTLPPGTVFNGATPAADCEPGCVGTTPATVTWTSACTVPLQPNQNCDILVDVVFPSGTLPSGTNVTNSFVADITPLGEPPQSVGPGTVTHPVTTFMPAPGAGFSKNMAGGTPNPPTLNQTFAYDLNVSNNGNVPLDNLVVIDTLPVEFQATSVTTGAYNNLGDFAAGEGVRVSYEKNTALGVFTLWGSSPNTGTNTTLTAPPPGLGAGEYITRIRWEYGQAQMGMGSSTRPLVTGRIVNPDNAGNPVAFGDNVQNCADLSAVFTAGPTNVSRNDCEGFNVSGPFVQLNPAKENLSGGGPFNPGQNVAWRLRVRSAQQSSDPVPLQGLVVTDLLPVDLIFSNWTFDDQGTGLPAPQVFDQIPNFAGTGRTLLRWRWNAGSGSLGVNQQVWVNIGTTIRSGAVAGSLSNTMGIDNGNPGLAQRCSNASATDTLDLDADGDTAETICTNTGSITVAPIAQLISGKTIRAVCDGGFVSDSAGTLLGGSLDYRLRVQNAGTVPMQNVVLIDILPFVGDTGVRDTNPRGSQWTPLLAAPIVPPAGTTLSYSTSGNPCRGEVGGPTTSCDAPNWSTVPPTPISATRSFKLEFGTRAVAPFDFVEFRFNMVTPAGVAPGVFAYNSFAYQADRGDGIGSLAAEPQKVGSELGTCEAAALGDYVWVDTNRDGIQNDGDTGLNDVYVQLFDNGGDGIAGTPDDGLLASTVTMDGPDSAPGWYRFPGLAPGTYRVCFHPPATFAPTAPGSGSDTSLDSDADPLTQCSAPVTLANGEDNPDIDLGLLPPDPAALGNYVWFDRNGDGVQNESPFDGINGVGVRLFLDNGDNVPDAGTDTFVATAVTDDDVYGRPGYYVFDGLLPTQPYFVQFVLPPTATGFTSADAGGDDSVDSDAAPGDGLSDIVAPGAGEFDPTLDAGLLLPTGTLSLGNQVWSDGDNDGIYEPENGEPGIDDVRLRLYADASGDGVPQLHEYIGATVTGTVAGFAGRYRFDNLAPGIYIVVVDTAASPALDGMSTSTGNDPAPDPDDDVDGDDNGTAIGALLASRAVTLTDNGEPTSEDGNNDSNLTVDFGFVAQAPLAYDYGDAPDSLVGSNAGNYRTVALDGGPSHLLGVPGAPYLGACVDGDDGTAQDATARDDDLSASGFVVGTCAAGGDEDGVVIDNPLQPGTSASISVTAGGPTACTLNAWIDWNGNGVFGDSAGETIASDLPVSPGPATVLTPPVPAGAKPGVSYARFRCASVIGLSSTGEAPDGEVEDYVVSILGTDFGDAPASYGTQGAGVAAHTVDAFDPLRLGQCVDMENDGQPGTGADGDDDTAGTSSFGALGCSDDEDGIVFDGTLSACQTASLTATIAGGAGQLDAWVDFNFDGDFSDPGEQIFASQPVVSGAQPLAFSVPCTAVESNTYARFRLSSVGALASNGLAPDGEVEDYVVSVGLVDFGDAPDSYGTTFGNGGPFHDLVAGFALGGALDGESDGQPSAGADGDGADEDGVTFDPGPLVACSLSNVSVSLANGPGVATPLLDAWIDWDGNGTFDDPRDRVATSLALVSGANSLPVNVPCDAASVASYARFRLSSTGVAGPGGMAADGEVEDYAIDVRGLDFGDLPDPSYPTLLASDGARHVVEPGFSLGATIDTEPDGQPSVGATGDGGDEDGVALPDTFVACKATIVPVTLTNSAGVPTPTLDAWIDWNSNGSFADAGEQAVTGAALSTGVNDVAVIAPCDLQQGQRAARFRLSSTGTDDPTGELPDGEVEDYIVGGSGQDYGDAPDSYGTLFASDGARHVVVTGYGLGANLDIEPDGQPSAAADGDGADEDGVTLPGTFVACTATGIDIAHIDTAGIGNARLDAWIDWDADGSFDAPRDQIANAFVLTPGSTQLSVTPPCDAAPGATYARFRVSAAGGHGPTGSGGQGEVEDYAVDVAVLDFGDAPASYATLLADNGARHVIVPGFTLGAMIDQDADGQPGAGADGDGADEDGVAVPALLLACTSASFTVTLDNTAALANARVDGWIDWNADGTFDEATDRVMTAETLVAGPNVILVQPPCDLPSGITHARFRLSENGVAAATGLAPDGEAEDYVVVTRGFDFGDAPDSYGTLVGSGAALHGVLPGFSLGASIDSEPDGQPTPAADGDGADEDGVTLPTFLRACTTATLQIVLDNAAAVADPRLDAWIDWNGDGAFDDPADRIASAIALAPGANSLDVDVPCDLPDRNTYARFRLSDTGVDDPIGVTDSGEVEDYAVIIGERELDFGDAPDSYATLLASDGPRHGRVPGFLLGASYDSETEGQPSVAADGDGVDEDGVTLPASLRACDTASLQIVFDNSGGVPDPRLDAWIDWNGDGAFDNATDRIATGLALAAGANMLDVPVSCEVASLSTYARFRLSGGGVAVPTGLAASGEVEDYAVTLRAREFDFGDADGAGFATLLANDGARHAVPLSGVNPVLGAVVDSEPNGQPDAQAAGDDANGDDEDGVTFDDVLSPGLEGSVTVSSATGGDLSAWIDFDRDGSWAADEQIAAGTTIPVGSTTLVFDVPTDADEGAAVARFRLVAAGEGAVAPNGLAGNGEIEDHLAPIGADEPAIGVGTCLITSDGRGAERNVEFDVVVGNYGNLPLTDVGAELDLASIFAQAESWQLVAATSDDLAVNVGFDGNGDTALLAPASTLAVDASGTVRVRLLIDPGSFAGPYAISADAAGTSPSGIVVTDVSQNGCDPDPDGDADPANNDEATELVFTLLPDAIVQPEIIPAGSLWSLLLLGLFFVLTGVWRQPRD